MLVERVSSFEGENQVFAAAAAEGNLRHLLVLVIEDGTGESSNLLQDAFQKSLRDLAGIQPGHLGVDHRLNELLRQFIGNNPSQNEELKMAHNVSQIPLGSGPPKVERRNVDVAAFDLPGR